MNVFHERGDKVCASSPSCKSAPTTAASTDPPIPHYRATCLSRALHPSFLRLFLILVVLDCVSVDGSGCNFGLSSAVLLVLIVLDRVSVNGSGCNFGLSSAVLLILVVLDCVSVNSSACNYGFSLVILKVGIRPLLITHPPWRSGLQVQAWSLRLGGR